VILWTAPKNVLRETRTAFELREDEAIKTARRIVEVHGASEDLSDYLEHSFDRLFYVESVVETPVRPGWV
jgi:hypothetical protein